MQRLKISIVTRLSVMLALIASVILLALLLIIDQAFNELRQNTDQTDSHYLQSTLEHQLAKDTQLMLSSLSANLAVPLYNVDLSAINNAISELRYYRKLRYIYVVDSNQRIVHDGTAQIDSYGKLISEVVPQKQLYVSHVWNDTELQLTTPIKVDQYQVGSIVASFEFEDAFNQLNRQIRDLQNDQRTILLGIKSSITHLLLLLLPISILLSFFLSRTLLQPLKTLTERANHFREGRQRNTFQLPRNDEIGELGQALEQMRQGLERSSERAHHIANIDDITQLPNRRWFQHKLHALLHNQPQQKPFAVLFLDLDHFKQVNDTSGHDLGDQILRMTAERLNSVLSRHCFEYQHPKPMLARLGGDEFVALIPEITNSEEVVHCSQQLIDAIEQPYLANGTYFNISCSIGITLYPKDGLTSAEMLKHADLAMYNAKRNGRRQFAFFHPQLTAEVRDRLQIYQGIREAIRENHLFLEYQPIYNLKNDRIEAVEALLRWNHPKQGRIPPGRFIPIIEESDLIIDVTRWVAHRACHDLKEILHHLRANHPFHLSINVSGAALHQADLAVEICKLKQTYDLPDKSLCIELTETSMIRHLESCERIIADWKAHGIDIWIDDFGTGYSSLSYLNQFEFDGLKIDQSFVFSLTEGHSLPLVEAIIAISKSLNIYTVAEGIETDAAKVLLTQLGVTYGQGFGLNRPMPLPALLELIDAS